MKFSGRRMYPPRFNSACTAGVQSQVDGSKLGRSVIRPACSQTDASWETSLPGGRFGSTNCCRCKSLPIAAKEVVPSAAKEAVPSALSFNNFRRFTMTTKSQKQERLAVYQWKFRRYVMARTSHYRGPIALLSVETNLDSWPCLECLT
ncbi:hypothetical protein D3C84_841470 [compost metagenome]